MSAISSKQISIPLLRFSGYKNAWESVLLDDVAKRGTGHTPNKKNSEYYAGNIKWVSLSDSNKLDKGEITDTNISIAAEGIKNSSAVIHQKGTVLLSRDAGVGKSAVMGDSMAVSQHFVTWTCGQRLDNWFLYHYLQTQKQLFERVSNGSTIKTIGMPFFKKLTIPLPEIEEQQKISNFFRSVDSWLNHLRDQKQSLETYKKGMIQKLFSQEIRFKDENGNSFPDWEIKKLGDVFTAVKGSGISKDEIISDGVNPCILYGELYTAYKEVIFEVKSKTNSKGATLSRIGDLLVPCSTTTTAIDLANVTALNQSNVLLGGDITILRSDNKMSNVFYAYYLTNFKKRELAKYGQGVTIIHVYFSHFKEMIVDVPGLPEQQKIAEFLISLDNIIEAKANEITVVEQWKKSLMQKMFI